MIKTVIFDLGNVMVNFKPMEFLKERYSDKDAEFLFSAVFDTNEWKELDNGTISEDGAWKNFVERNPEKEKIFMEVKDCFYNIFTPIQTSVAAMKALSEKGYNLLYLSNIHIGIFGHLKKTYDFFKLFNGGIISADYHMLKPNDDIYLKLLEVYPIAREEAVFIDDTAVNTDVAEKLGFKTIHLYDPNILDAALKAMGIL